jgi:hypothetical protein
VAGYYWFVWFVQKRRREALERVCPKLGLKYQPEPEDAEWEALLAFPLFNIGYDRETRNLMTGNVAEWNVSLIDHFFRRSMKTKRDIDPEDRDEGLQTTEKAFGANVGPDSRSYHQTIVAFWDVCERIPDFQLVTREGWFHSHTANHRTPKALIEDLHIGKEQRPAFAKRYKVGGKDREAIRQFFSATLMESLMYVKGWDVETVEGHILVYQEGRVQSPYKLPAFLEGASALVKAFKAAAR